MSYNYPQMEDSYQGVQQPKAPHFSHNQIPNNAIQNNNNNVDANKNVHYYPNFNPQPDSIQQQPQQQFQQPNNFHYNQGNDFNNVVGFSNTNIQQGMNMGAKQQFMNNYNHDTENQKYNYHNQDNYHGEDGDLNSLYGEEDVGSLSKGQQIKFIRKVYFILLSMITVSCLFIIQAKENNHFRFFIMKYPFLMILASVALIATCYTLTCYKSLSRKVPVNYILLGSFTFAQSYLLAGLVISYQKQSVMLAGGTTFFMFLGLTLYALWTKEDFTMKGGALFLGLCTLCGGLFINMFLQSSFLNLLMNIGGLFIFGMYLIYDTQMIVGGHKYSFSYDDYIVAALQMYIDIVNIFIYLLKILGNRDN